MKCVILAGFLMTLLGHGCGNVLRCSLEGTDAACSNDEEKVQSPVEVEEKPARQTECLAGSEWESNCHYCRCADSGVAECLKQEACDSGVFSEPINCKPNTTFERECNTCVCLENGLALCTIQYCRRSAVPKKSELPTGKECAPGSTWRSRCNDCKCTASGYAACTEAACVEQDAKPEIRCAPNTMWQNDCNTCWCSAEGRAMCTKVGCVSFADVKVEEIADDQDFISESSFQLPKAKTINGTCKAKAMFIKDCNVCWCNDDGTGYYCTRRVCVNELPEEPIVEEKPEELRILKKECRPYEVFELDCNMCRCNADGKSFSCTRRLCPDAEDSKNTSLVRTARAAQEAPYKACQPGQEFRLDCNKCLCDNSGQDFSCTRIDCNAPNNDGARTKRETSNLVEVSAECTAGSTFEQGCNTCKCTADGHHAMCTNKKCVQENQISTDVHGSDAADPGFRCNPGEQFKKDCNDCTCSADGRSTFCTLRLCDQDITSGL
ncbi:uncharacterized protein LOC135082810 isoform X1 [Ostrinia nubilalis]|uniref:uncharacterized protein LOC135082810 isoform X1 n=1 Tax=Ostrinia nubilalis TaxID=29057 RepID=UPI0030824467